MTKPDTRGVDALKGDMAASVALLPARIWGEMETELGELPPAPHIDPFDEEPWQALPTMEELEKLWLVAPAVDIMIAQLAVRVHGEGPDLPRYIASQRELAYMELAWIKERELENEQAADTRHSAADGPVGAAAAAGSRGAVPRGSKNGHKVGKGRKAPRDPDTWGAQKISGRSGAGKNG